MANIPIEPQITEYLHRKATRLRIPLNGTFELTPLCNMDCKMCYVRMTKEQQEKVRPLRTAEEWLRLGKTAKEQGMVYLLITGGEPFLRPDFREIFQGLHKMGFIVSINSNGTMIDEKTMEWLKETPPIRINMTLYGASDETYERLCGNPRGFTQVTKAIRLLKEAGITVKLNCSVTPYNAHDLEAMFAFAEKEGLLIQATSYMFPPLRKNIKMVGKNDRFTPEEAAYYSAKIEMLSGGEEYFLEKMKKGDWSAVSMDTAEDCQALEGEGIRCRAGRCSFWITWDGRMLPCGMLVAEQAPNVFEEDFSKAWEETMLQAGKIRLPGKCAGCDLKDKCRACAAMVLTESGNYCDVPQYRCQMSQHYPAACKALEKELLEKRAGDTL